jgi:aconitate hydratase
MDARSIAATVVKGGFLTPATELAYEIPEQAYVFEREIYDKKVYNGFGAPDPRKELKLGPNIADWPVMIALPDNLLLQVAAAIEDPVTTTDELIPSGETSSYRSNPLKLAEFTLSRKDPQYVQRAKAIQSLELAREALVQQDTPAAIPPSLQNLMEKITAHLNIQEMSAPDLIKNTGIGTVVFARKPGDGSAREQAASCQKVLGGWANIAHEYATKRYRSNLINWGMLPLTIDPHTGIKFEIGDLIWLPGIKEKITEGKEIFLPLSSRARSDRH